jgi:hypothetical protein
LAKGFDALHLTHHGVVDLNLGVDQSVDGVEVEIVNDLLEQTADDLFALVFVAMRFVAMLFDM